MVVSDGFNEQSVIGWGNRGWVEIIGMILAICEKGALKTHVMYRCNLNTKQMDQYLQFLQAQRLIEIKSEGQYAKRPLYLTTSLGHKYVHAYKQIEKLFK